MKMTTIKPARERYEDLYPENVRAGLGDSWAVLGEAFKDKEISELRAYIAELESRPAAPVVATVIKNGADRQWVSEALGSLPDGIYSLSLTTAAPVVAEVLHKIDAAMSLLRVASGIALEKIAPAALRKQVAESVSNASGANGAGDEYIFADVYEQICEMMSSHVGADGSGLPASVVESYQFLLEFWLAANHVAGSPANVQSIEEDHKFQCRLYHYVAARMKLASGSITEDEATDAFRELIACIDARNHAAAEPIPTSRYEYRARHENGSLLDWAPLDVDSDEQANAYLNHGQMGEWRKTPAPLSASEARTHISDSEYSKAVRQEIKSRFDKPSRVQEGAVLLTYSTDDIRAAENGGKLDVRECATWFIQRSEEGYAK